MGYLNDRWSNFRTAVEAGAVGVTLIGTGIWSFNFAEQVRGYKAAGGEVLLTIGAAVLVGVVAHKIFDKVEAKLNEQLAEEYRKMEEIRRINKVRMYTIEEARTRRSRCNMYSVGE